MKLAPHEVETFSAIVEQRLGFHRDESKLSMFTDLLERRLADRGQSCRAYLESLVTDPAELRTLAVDLTVPETYFFRNIDQFHAFTEVAIPARLAAQGETKHLRLLSVGCASGEEPYTLAMIAREVLDPSVNVSILAIDVNHVVLEKARRARYSAWSLRETPVESQRRWFRRNGNEHVLDESIRNAVHFEEHNLVDIAARSPWPAASFDVIFWRNVMMYFTPAHQRATIARITQALVPGGYLFLGHAETLRGVSNHFHLRHTHGTFYYQRRLDADVRQELPEPAFEAPPAPLVPAGADSWVETIGRASSRIKELSVASQPTFHETPARAPEESSAWDLSFALDLLEKERFGDAIERLDALPAEAARDPHVLLLRAALLTHSGQLVKAEEVCHALLEIDELDAGAHYLLALCRAGIGDARAAADHDQVAAYLDPAFAMPRLHLGLLARRANDRESARRDLGQALVLLHREDASRLRLFGGGFGRETLVTLCKTELIACGGTP